MNDSITEHRDDTPGPGHNAAPLAEELVEETKSLVTEAAELVELAHRVVIDDQDDANRAAAVLGKMVDLYQKADKAREERKKPHLEAGRTIDGHYKAIWRTLVGDEPAKKKLGLFAEVLAKVNAWNAAQKAKADAARRAKEEEARQTQAAADAAARAAETARQNAAQGVAGAGVTAVENDIAAQQAQAKADLLTQQAAQTVAPKITGYGASVGSRKTWVHTITDFDQALTHALVVNHAAIAEAVDQVIKRQITAGIREWPGADITSTDNTSIRRS